MAILIQGLTASSKTPRAVAQLEFGVGAISVGQLPRRVLIAGVKGTGSTLADNSITEFAEVDDAKARIGARSEGARMVAKAIINGARVHYLALEAIDSAAQASMTLTFAGTWSTSGTAFVHFGGKIHVLNVLASDTPTTVAARAETLVNNDDDMPGTGVATAGALAITITTAGARGNNHIIYVDLSNAPAGLTVTPSGGTAASQGQYRFGSGSGVDDLTDALDAAFASEWDYQAWAPNDATNAAAIIAQVRAKAHPSEMRYDNPAFAYNGTMNAAATIAQANINEAMAQCLWFEDSRNHPYEFAARWAAYRSVTEAMPRTELGDPNHRYDFAEAFWDFLPHINDAVLPRTGITDAALNVGLSPIITGNSRPVMCRSITSRSLSGSLPDYRTLDTGDAMVPQRVAQHFVVKWETEHAPANPYVGPNPVDGSPPPAGRSTPDVWRGIVTADMKRFERQNIVTDVDELPPEAEYNSSLHAIMTSIPTKATKQNHIAGFLVRQVA